ncbi:hypothetical protein GA0115233_102173 [Streptomyces sp. DI166]|nr:hypothetical protein GA0115233_102173 [Streptomyces sp. DI166]
MRQTALPGTEPAPPRKPGVCPPTDRLRVRARRPANRLWIMSAPQGPTTQSTPPHSPTSTFTRNVALVAAPGTIVFALLYYFGSIYLKAYYTALGVPPEDLGFSIQGVVSNSTSGIFVPVCLLLGGGLVVFLVLGRLGRALAGPERAVLRHRVVVWLLVVGVVLVLIGFPTFVTDTVSVFPPGWPRRFLPALTVAAGATLAVFGVQLHLSENPPLRVRQTPGTEQSWLAGGTLLLGVLALSLFYEMALYVADVGRGDAIVHADRGYPGAPFVVVHSRVRLLHSTQGIRFEDHGARNEPYRYVYRGFRIVAKAPTRFYLVSHASTSYAQHHLVVLPDNNTTWLEIRAD